MQRNDIFIIIYRKSRRENKKIKTSHSHPLSEGTVQSNLSRKLVESNKISSKLVLPWWMRIIIERKKDHLMS